VFGGSLGPMHTDGRHEAWLTSWRELTECGDARFVIRDHYIFLQILRATSFRPCRCRHPEHLYILTYNMQAYLQFVLPISKQSCHANVLAMWCSSQMLLRVLALNLGPLSATGIWVGMSSGRNARALRFCWCYIKLLLGMNHCRSVWWGYLWRAPTFSPLGYSCRCVRLCMSLMSSVTCTWNVVFQISSSSVALTHLLEGGSILVT
jgi:hypothetical protein